MLEVSLNFAASSSLVSEGKTKFNWKLTLSKKQCSIFQYPFQDPNVRFESPTFNLDLFREGRCYSTLALSLVMGISDSHGFGEHRCCKCSAAEASQILAQPCSSETRATRPSIWLKLPWNEKSPIKLDRSWICSNLKKTWITSLLRETNRKRSKLFMTCHFQTIQGARPSIPEISSSSSSTWTWKSSSWLPIEIIFLVS